MGLSKNMSNMLKALKKSRNKSLSEFSADMGISRSALQDFLKGEGNPTLETVDLISEKLGVPPATLLLDAFDQHQLQFALHMTETMNFVSELKPDKRSDFAKHFMKMIQLFGTDDTIWNYRVVQEKAYHTDIGNYTTYGIKVSSYETEYEQINDVSTELNVVEQMANLFTEFQLSPVHFADAVSDMLL